MMDMPHFFQFLFVGIGINMTQEVIAQDIPGYHLSHLEWMNRFAPKNGSTNDWFANYPFYLKTHIFDTFIDIGASHMLNQWKFHVCSSVSFLSRSKHSNSQPSPNLKLQQKKEVQLVKVAYRS